MNRNDLTVVFLLMAAILLLIAQITVSPMLFAIVFPILMFLWMWLGALKDGKVRGGAKYSLIGVVIVWLIGFISMTAMDHSTIGSFFGGLPSGTAIMMYLVWLLPFIIGTLVYSIRFEKDYITYDDLEEFTKSTGVKMEELTSDVRESKGAK